MCPLVLLLPMRECGRFQYSIGYVELVLICNLTGVVDRLPGSETPHIGHTLSHRAMANNTFVVKCVMAQMVELSLSSKKKQLFLLEKMAWKGNVPPVVNTSAPLPDTNPANKNAPISAKSVYIAVLLDIGAAWNHWNQKSHSEFFINR
ncbi:uncharacterized protein [Physcomitrium patens]|uniref:uncharacterized protein isoform X3 n=1 Tax=Physcomitrium patens TaxID=3218 RepID=UPI000D1758AB|nr:uncharacterized protein LOC112274498 isoform X3 [Physcomitrium patens]|eukprot:XP_024359829.1 uncharacterized protein LOC112274498 isoform X3 [Physcomitrella patens]